jgi:hypothetical protein
MTYKFTWLNNGLEITPTKISWTFAGFSTLGNGILSVDILLETTDAKFSVTLSTEGQATDRSNEAIEQLMYKLLELYKV